MQKIATAVLALVLTAPGFGGGQVHDPTPPGLVVTPEPRFVTPGQETAVWMSSAPAPTFEEQVVELVNAERWANGQLPPLKHNGLLDSSSETHSSNMATRDFFSHCDLDTGTSPFTRMIAAGYSYNFAAENIAAGNVTPSSVMNVWMGSSGHRANILATDYREIGVGHVYQGTDQSNVRLDLDGNCSPDSTGEGPFLHYWTQNFGRRNAAFPVVIEREAHEVSSALVGLYLYGSGWATQMRIRNEGGLYTPWLPFTANYAWSLSPGAGPKSVEVEIRNGATVFSASDSIWLSVEALFADGFESGNTDAWSDSVP